MKQRLGIIIGRFQVADLTPGHHAFIDRVIDDNDETVVFLGVANQQFTKNNPLSFDMRKRMIQHHYELEILRLPDAITNDQWSQNVDSVIKALYGGYEVTLFCGRDGFKPYYTGVYPVVQYDDVTPGPSGTESRLATAADHTSNSDRRAGIIYAVQNAFTRVNPVIDVAILDESGENVLMGRKKKEESAVGLRFVGGFVDAKDTSLEHTVKREALEETGCEVGDIKYVGSFVINDWRFRWTPEIIMSSFFVAKRLHGITRANDDLHIVQWVPVQDVSKWALPTHLPLARALEEYVRAGKI